MKNTRSILTVMCAFVIFTGRILADEPEENPNNIVVLSPQEELDIQTYRSSLVPEDDQDDMCLADSFLSYDDRDSDYLHRIHQGAYKHPVAITIENNIYLHDGSLWYVYPDHRRVVKGWVKSDRIIIKPNASCFSSYSYVFHNRENGQIVQISLLEPPIETGAYTHWVTDIDYANRLVYLNDNTSWHVNPRDSSFNKWRTQDRVILGVNNKWRTREFPHILINTKIYRAPYCEVENIR
ncbi:MAG: hypothetical protein H0W88_12285 [Parachlamydiaceae bacterium]|nr:hypothetical protein [Parachlamydiaceae bacterium]